MQIMRNAIFIALVALSASGHAKEFDKLLGRANEAVFSARTDLDDAALGKSSSVPTAMSSPTSLFAIAPRATPIRAGVGSFVPAASVAASSRLPGRSPVPALRQVQARAEAAAKPDAKTVKSLRDMTGAGMMDCKKALVENNGDFEGAKEWLRKKGLAAAGKRAGKATSEGLIESYIHPGSKLGVLVEVNCETDFVAKTPEFKVFAQNIAMQIAASPAIEVVDEEAISPEAIAKEKAILAESDDLKGKPEAVLEKILEGKVKKWMKTLTLVDQPYIRDPDTTVADYIKSGIAQFGENIKVAKFARFTLGS